MAASLAIPLFLVSAAVTLAAAATFARRLDLLGARFGAPEVLIGLLTAMAADGPEVSSALVALFKGAHATTVGVVVGSGVFNITTMVGVSALLTGAVRVRRDTLVLEGSVALAATATVSALLLRWISAPLAVVLLACVLAPYVASVLAGPRIPAWLHAPWLLSHALDEGDHRQPADAGVHFATHRALALMARDGLLIVAGSFGMVQAALSLGDRWGIRPALIGVLVLGPLTSLPNGLTGIRLGLARRGAALVTEALNSNTINLVAGVAIPALFTVLAVRSRTERLDLALLALMTAITLALLATRGGVRRAGGALLVALYLAFVVIQVS